MSAGSENVVGDYLQKLSRNHNKIAEIYLRKRLGRYPAERERIKNLQPSNFAGRNNREERSICVGSKCDVLGAVRFGVGGVTSYSLDRV